MVAYARNWCSGPSTSYRVVGSQVHTPNSQIKGFKSVPYPQFGNLLDCRLDLRQRRIEVTKLIGGWVLSSARWRGGGLMDPFAYGCLRIVGVSTQRHEGESEWVHVTSISR